MANIHVNYLKTSKGPHTGTGKDSIAPLNERALHEDSSLFKLAQKLQTSLQLDDILQIFYETAAELQQINHISFQSEGKGIEVSLGKAARHQCQYNLNLDNQQLGAIGFTRSKRFTEKEQQSLENLLCLLVYPLRNALLYQEAVSAAVKDPLTGVCNRSTLDEVMQREVDISKRHGNDFTVLMIDIDNFKPINDTYGHAVGDCVIKSLANTLTSCARGSDYIFRYGGEEFTMLLSNTDVDGARHLAERIRNAVEKLVCISDDASVNFTISVGMTALTGDDTVASLLSRADKALYNAKDSGKNCVKCMIND
jgi:diguanylate cyclase (GGDEF)-like protein